jgi:hypothetical protein
MHRIATVRERLAKSLANLNAQPLGTTVTEQGGRPQRQQSGDALNRVVVRPIAAGPARIVGQGPTPISVVGLSSPKVLKQADTDPIEIAACLQHRRSNRIILLGPQRRTAQPSRNALRLLATDLLPGRHAAPPRPGLSAPLPKRIVATRTPLMLAICPAIAASSSASTACVRPSGVDRGAMPCQRTRWPDGTSAPGTAPSHARTSSSRTGGQQPAG